MPTQGFLSVSILDYDSEIGTFRCRIPELTLLNFAAVTGQIATLVAALTGLPDAMSGGTLHKYSFGNETVVGIVPPNDAEMQREAKALVSYHDPTTFKRYSLEIPVIDTDNIDPGDRKHYNIGDGADVDDFIAAFEALALTPDGNAPVVDEITHVGRRL